MRVIVVAGPPCGGKTTYVQEHREASDVVLEVDSLADHIGTEHGELSRSLARSMYNVAVSAAFKIPQRKHVGQIVWVTTTKPDAPIVYGAAELVVCNPGMDEALRRADDRPNPADGLHDRIRQWYQQAHPSLRV